MFASDDWVVSMAQSEHGGVVVRSRSCIPEEQLRANHGYLVLVTWTYEPNDAGMPDAQTQNSINGMEDALDAALSDEWGVEAAAITGAGQKEWRFYTPDPDGFAARFTQALAGHQPYPIELQAFEDPDWEGLAELIPASRA